MSGSAFRAEATRAKLAGDQHSGVHAHQTLSFPFIHSRTQNPTPVRKLTQKLDERAGFASTHAGRLAQQAHPDNGEPRPRSPCLSHLVLALCVALVSPAFPCSIFPFPWQTRTGVRAGFFLTIVRHGHFFLKKNCLGSFHVKFPLWFPKKKCG